MRRLIVFVARRSPVTVGKAAGALLAAALMALILMACASSHRSSGGCDDCRNSVRSGVCGWQRDSDALMRNSNTLRMDSNALMMDSSALQRDSSASRKDSSIMQGDSYSLSNSAHSVLDSIVALRQGRQAQWSYSRDSTAVRNHGDSLRVVEHWHTLLGGTEVVAAERWNGLFYASERSSNSAGVSVQSAVSSASHAVSSASHAVSSSSVALSSSAVSSGSSAVSSGSSSVSASVTSQTSTLRGFTVWIQRARHALLVLLAAVAVAVAAVWLRRHFAQQRASA